jgi:outer membrane protein OmpA-like peptidoglycan-associated protein
MKTVVGIGVALALSLPATTRAEPKERWLLSAGGGLARTVTAPQAELYGLGATGSGGFYRSLMPWMLLGTRFTASMVSNQRQAPSNPNLAEPGTGGLFTLTLAGRLRPFADRAVASRATGLFLEGGAGVARTGPLWRPAVEAGLGYGFDLGPVVLSPVIRFQQVIERDSLLPDDARIVSGGLELTFNDGSDTPPPGPAPIFISVAPEDTDFDGLADVRDPCPYLAEDVDGFRDDDGCPDHDVDSDGVADLEDDCPDDPESINGVNDHDGCPDSGKLEVVKGLIVVDERILFGFDSSRIREAGLEKLLELAASADQHPEWVGMVIEGHADRRGTRAYNHDLSLRRAQAVQRALREFGLLVPMQAEGYGEERPLDPRGTSEAYQRNRRVEIRVQEERQRTAEVGTAPMTLLEEGADR